MNICHELIPHRYPNGKIFSIFLSLTNLRGTFNEILHKEYTEDIYIYTYHWNIVSCLSFVIVGPRGLVYLYFIEDEAIFARVLKMVGLKLDFGQRR